MTLSVYTNLKEQVIFAASASERHGDLLKSLKEEFKEDINSERKLEQITSFGQLIKVLELRDVLSEENLEPLKVIASRIFNNEVLLKSISEYEASYVPRQYINQYAVVTPIDTSRKVSYTNTYVSPNNISEIKKNRIFKTVYEEISTFWRTFGRYLKIRECVIEDIDINNPLMKNKAKKLLEEYEKEADPQRWFLQLCEALEKSHRKDLSKKINRIMVMDI